MTELPWFDTVLSMSYRHFTTNTTKINVNSNMKYFLMDFIENQIDLRPTICCCCATIRLTAAIVTQFKPILKLYLHQLKEKVGHQLTQSVPSPARREISSLACSYWSRVFVSVRVVSYARKCVIGLVALNSE